MSDIEIRDDRAAGRLEAVGDGADGEVVGHIEYFVLESPGRALSSSAFARVMKVNNAASAFGAFRSSKSAASKVSLAALAAAASSSVPPFATAKRSAKSPTRRVAFIDASSASSVRFSSLR